MVSYTNFITDGNVIQLFSSSLTLKQNKLERLKVVYSLTGNKTLIYKSTTGFYGSLNIVV
jgi:hypothetical protein